MTVLLKNTNEVVDAIEKMITHTDAHLYITGPAARPVMNAVFKKVDSLGYTGEIQLTVPSLTGSESLGSSFLYQLYRLAKKIRIQPKATHLMVATPSKAMLLSVGADRTADNQLMGVLSSEPDAVEAINAYCKDLWETGSMLRLSAPGSDGDKA